VTAALLLFERTEFPNVAVRVPALLRKAHIELVRALLRVPLRERWILAVSATVVVRSPRSAC